MLPVTPAEGQHGAPRADSQFRYVDIGGYHRLGPSKCVRANGCLRRRRRSCRRPLSRIAPTATISPVGCTTFPVDTRHDSVGLSCLMGRGGRDLSLRPSAAGRTAITAKAAPQTSLRRPAAYLWSRLAMSVWYGS